MPFGKYRNMAHCMNENRDKKDPAAYCAEIMRRVEGTKKTSKKKRKS